MKRTTKAVQKSLESFVKITKDSAKTNDAIDQILHSPSIKVNPESIAALPIASELKIFAWNVNGLRAVIKSG